MIASGCSFGSRTTLAMRVFFQRSYTALWHAAHFAEPTYVSAACACSSAHTATIQTMDMITIARILTLLLVLDVELRELLAEGGHLWSVVEDDVRLEWMVEEVVLVVGLGLVEL